MRILILGGDGMLGHQLFKHLGIQHDTRVTLHGKSDDYKEYGLFTTDNAFSGVDVRSIDRLADVINSFKPNSIINAVGVVKQRKESKEYIPSIEINSLLPHRLVELCRPLKIRLIHMSTDCVFSGSKGRYKESDPSDAEDLYGKTKYLGEVYDSNCLTLRTSIIGRELSRKNSLLEWFLGQKSQVRGFKNAIFSGFTTNEMSRIIEMILMKYPDKSGLYHVSSEAISKFDLLSLIKKTLNLPVEIIPDEELICDRSLDSTRFRKEFCYQPPKWDSMINEIVNDILEAKS